MTAEPNDRTSDQTIGGANVEANAEANAQVSDQALIEAIIAQDSQGLAGLYDRYSRRMLGAALRVLNNRRDAEDLVHDVFMEVWQCADRYDRSRGPVIAWMLTRVRSRSIDRLRSLERARRYQRATQPEPAPAETPTDETSDRFRSAVACLSENHRTIVELGYYRGLTCSEMAVHCAIPIGTVKSRLSAALAALRQHLEVSAEGHLSS